MRRPRLAAGTRAETLRVMPARGQLDSIVLGQYGAPCRLRDKLCKSDVNLTLNDRAEE